MKGAPGSNLITNVDLGTNEEEAKSSLVLKFKG